MELWIPITVAAAFLQNLRSALQKKLSGEVSVDSATTARFLFAIPFALLYLYGLLAYFNAPVPTAHLGFLLWMAVGGIAQIVGTYALLASFREQNFAVGTAWSKSETVQAAMFGLVFLGESISLLAGVGIFVSLLGLAAMSLKREVGWRALITSSAARLGLLSGAGFAAAAVAFRAATLAVESEHFWIQAAYTLACVTVFQSLCMVLWMRRPSVAAAPSLAALFRRWQVAVPIGLAGMAASAGWFTAMTLTQAAYVRALGQIELLFTFAATLIFFREHIRAMEWLGVLLLVAGILILLLGV